MPTFWKVYARNKRSPALDYRSAEGLALLRRLVGTAQVLVENFVPGKLERIGLAPAELLARPQGIQCVERGFIERASLLDRLEKFGQGLDCNLGQLRFVILFEFWLRNRM